MMCHITYTTPEVHDLQRTGYRPLARFPTFPSHAPTRQLDHILLRGPLGDVIAAQAPELPLSDHRPLVAEVNVLR